jgi:hypothetical protein
MLRQIHAFLQPINFWSSLRMSDDETWKLGHSNPTIMMIIFWWKLILYYWDWCCHCFKMDAQMVRNSIFYSNKWSTSNINKY